MFSLVHALPLRRLLLEQAPTLALSLGIAEVAYKFHSFLLEASAFLITWYALDALRHVLTAQRGVPEKSLPHCDS